MASDFKKNESAYISLLEGLREELGVIRLQGGISDQLVNWHRRSAACAQSITTDVPSCANLCTELISIDFEMPPEFAASLPEELSDHRIAAAASETFFRRKCDETDEILNTLIIVLRKIER